MKHCFMIMVHNQIELLKNLLIQIDNANCVIIIHVDAKCKEFDKNNIVEFVKNAELVFVDSIKVYWGDSSQMQAEYLLIKKL